MLPQAMKVGSASCWVDPERPAFGFPSACSIRLTKTPITSTSKETRLTAPFLRVLLTTFSSGPSRIARRASPCPRLFRSLAFRLTIPAPHTPTRRLTGPLMSTRTGRYRVRRDSGTRTSSRIPNTGVFLFSASSGPIRCSASLMLAAKGTIWSRRMNLTPVMPPCASV